MNLYVLSIFLASAQLFIVQPMFAKRLLPILGGTPSVWTTCMLFYQLVLLGGYTYAHLLSRQKNVRYQVATHLIVILAPLAVLAAGPPAWSPPNADHAVQWLLIYLLVSIGAPFFVLSTNAPLVQKWFSLKFSERGKSAYALYSASNAGSMLALLAYPFLIEPHLRLSEQYKLLQICYVAFVIVMVAIMFAIFKEGKKSADEGHDEAESPALSETSCAPLKRWSQRLGWVFLAFVPSSLLLSVTTYITSDIAPCPLLWVVPLALYLLTFIIAFAEKQIVSQKWLNVIYSVCLISLAVVFFWKAVALNFAFMFPLHLFTLFLAALLCHTRLAHSKPETTRLTEFYLCLSIGGALGGIFNTLIAPQIFKTLFEYPLGLLLSCAGLVNPSQPSEKSNWRFGGLLICVSLASVAVLFAVSSGLPSPWDDYRILVVLAPAAICSSFAIRQPFFMAACLAIVFFVGGKFWRPDFLFEQRNVFGTLAVAEVPEKTHVLIHGAIVHGAEIMDQGTAPEPLTYYHHDSPIGHIFNVFNQQWRAADVAVIGLGTGSLAAYGQPGQHWTFYEINPLVTKVALDPALFTYLLYMQGEKSIKIGDGRQSIGETRDKTLSLIVLDAFSSDSIPVHLLTREALQIYKNKLADGGLIVFHISSRAVDLTSVLRELAKDASLACLVEQTGGRKDKASSHKFASKWLVMAKDYKDIAVLQQRYTFVPPSAAPSASLWTDDFSNVFETLRFEGSL
ncbi:MAG: hypothetical protein P4L53_23110 [Candidatus Obscuribacterales bacterium]|nr:hypothetical protein [Candidatus Obscuribacterales bacterium]